MTIIEETDHGTPAVTADEAVTVTVDGREVTVPAGTSVMRAAAEAGISIPKLCATDSLAAFGQLPALPRRGRGRHGDPRLVHDALHRRHGRRHPDRAGPGPAPQRHGALPLRPPRRTATAAPAAPARCRRSPGETGVAEVRYGLAGAHHLDEAPDRSNPYFDYDPAACIVCSRCVRACGEVQGTFALTVEGRGFDSRVTTGGPDFLHSECVSCGACVQACPTDALTERSVVELGMPTRAVLTTCAYCGVGCSFRAEVEGEGEETRVVRMVPWKDGGANEGHSCVKGRFAYGYTNHADRQLEPMVRDGIDEPWRVVSWEEAIAAVADGFRAIQARHGVGAIGGISSSRCTNEEVYVVQKMVRAAFGNNNVDTCARVCHSPTGYGLNHAFGTSAGTQDFASVEQADVILLIGANPTDAHPVFASRMKRRIREGARIVVADPRRIDLVRSPHVEAAFHLPVRPGTNVAFVNAMCHVIVTEGLLDEEFVRTRTEGGEEFLEFIAGPEHSPEATEEVTGIPAADLRRRARLYAAGPNSAIYYGLGVTEHSQGSTMVMGMANLAMITGNLGREGVGVNPLRGQNNVQGSCDMGSFPHELPGYRHVSRPEVREIFESRWGVSIQPEPGLRIPNMFDAAIGGSFRGLYVQGEDIAQSDPNTRHVEAALRAMELVVVQDLFLNETARFAHVFLPGTSFLEKDGTFTNAERRSNRVRPVMPRRAGKDEWQVVCDVATAMGYPMSYDSPAQIMEEIAATTPTFAGVTFDRLDTEGSMQWPVTDAAPNGTPTMHVGSFVRGLGQLTPTVYVPTTERTNRPFPLVLTTGRILTQYNVGAQTRRTPNDTWHPEDVLEIHPSDAELRGICDRRRRRARLAGGCHPAHGAGLGADAPRRRLHDLPPPRHRGQRRDHRELGLGDELPRVQGDGGPGDGRDRGDPGGRRGHRRGRGPARGRGPRHGHRRDGPAPMNDSLPPVLRLGEDLVRNFSWQGPQAAASAVAAHIAKFWEPRMRLELLRLVDAGDPRVDPVLARAAAGLRTATAGRP